MSSATFNLNAQQTDLHLFFEGHWIHGAIKGYIITGNSEVETEAEHNEHKVYY